MNSRNDNVRPPPRALLRRQSSVLPRTTTIEYQVLSYKPAELQSIFGEALDSLTRYQCRPIEILENLCKDFLKTIILKQSFSIQLSTLSIKAKGVGPQSIQEAQQRYEDLLNEFTTMRQSFTKELATIREGQKFKFQNRKQPSFPQAPVNFFDDLSHLTQQNKHHQGTMIKNPDFLSQNAQLAITQRFDFIKLHYEMQIQTLIQSNSEMQEQMQTFKKISEKSQNFFKLEDISIQSMVAILALVVKAKKGPNEMVKALEVWVAMEQLLGRNFFTDVISQYYGLEPEPAQGLITKFKDQLDQLREWCKDLLDKQQDKITAHHDQSMVHSSTTESHLTSEIALLWDSMRDYFKTSQKTLEKKFAEQSEQRELENYQKHQILQDQYTKLVVYDMKPKPDTQGIMRFLVQSKYELEVELTRTKLAHDILEYTGLKLNEERYFMLDKVKQSVQESQTLRQQVLEQKEAYWKQKAEFEGQLEINQEQTFYVEALEAELDRVSADVKKSQVLHPDLKDIKVNPNTQLKRQLSQARVVFMKLAIATRQRILRSCQVTVSTGTDICNVNVALIEKFKTEIKTFKAPRTDSGCQTDEAETEEQMCQTFIYRKEVGNLTELTGEKLTEMKKYLAKTEQQLALKIKENSAMETRIKGLQQTVLSSESKTKENRSIIQKLEEAMKKQLNIVQAQKQQIADLKDKNGKYLQVQMKLKEDILSKFQKNRQKTPRSKDDATSPKDLSARHKQMNLLMLQEPQSVHLDISQMHSGQSSSSDTSSQNGSQQTVGAADAKEAPSDQSPSSNKVLISKLHGIRISTSTRGEMTPSSRYGREGTPANNPVTEFTQAVTNASKLKGQSLDKEKLVVKNKSKRTKSQSRASSASRTTGLNQQNSADYKAFINNFEVKIHLPNSLEGLTRFFDQKHRRNKVDSVTQTSVLSPKTTKYGTGDFKTSPQIINISSVDFLQPDGSHSNANDHKIQRKFAISSEYLRPKKNKSAMSMAPHTCKHQLEKRASQDLYLNYRQQLLFSMREPNYFQVDSHSQQVKKLKHIVKGRAALPSQLLAKSSDLSHHFGN